MPAQPRLVTRRRRLRYARVTSLVSSKKEWRNPPQFARGRNCTTDGKNFPAVLQVDEMVEQEEHRNPDEHDYGHLDAGLAVDFGDEVRGGNINRDAGGNGQAVAYCVLTDRHGQNAGNGCDAEQHRSEPRASLAEAAGQHHRRDGEAFGNFVEEDGEKEDPAKPRRDEKPGGNGDAVEESVDYEAEQD